MAEKHNLLLIVIHSISHGTQYYNSFHLHASLPSMFSPSFHMFLNQLACLHRNWVICTSMSPKFSIVRADRKSQCETAMIKMGELCRNQGKESTISYLLVIHLVECAKIESLPSMCFTFNCVCPTFSSCSLISTIVTNKRSQCETWFFFKGDTINKCAFEHLKPLQHRFLLVERISCTPFSRLLHTFSYDTTSTTPCYSGNITFYWLKSLYLNLLSSLLCCFFVILTQ